MRVSTNPAGLKNPTMEAFFVSTAIVALAEMGDKTQLLALVLAARFRKPWPIVLGILVATLVNHGLAGGAQAADYGSMSVPSVWRTNRTQAAARVDALSSGGMDDLEIPAFLRKQAD